MIVDSIRSLRLVSIHRCGYRERLCNSVLLHAGADAHTKGSRLLRLVCKLSTRIAKIRLESPSRLPEPYWNKQELVVLSVDPTSN